MNLSDRFFPRLTFATLCELEGRLWTGWFSLPAGVRLRRFCTWILPTWLFTPDFDAKRMPQMSHRNGWDSALLCFDFSFPGVVISKKEKSNSEFVRLSEVHSCEAAAGWGNSGIISSSIGGFFTSFVANIKWIVRIWRSRLYCDMNRELHLSHAWALFSLFFFFFDFSFTSVFAIFRIIFGTRLSLENVSGWETPSAVSIGCSASITGSTVDLLSFGLLAWIVFSCLNKHFAFVYRLSQMLHANGRLSASLSLELFSFGFETLQRIDCYLGFQFHRRKKFN